MSLRFSDIVPKLSRGEAQRGEGKQPEPAAKPQDAPAPEEAAAEHPAAEQPAAEQPAAEPGPPEEKPELEPEAPVQVETEFVAATKKRDPDTGSFDLGSDAASFAEDLLERAIGAEADAAPHPAAAPEPAAADAPAIPKSFGFDFDVDPNAPESALAKAVSSALSEDPPAPFNDDPDGGGERELEDGAAPEPPEPPDASWLDRPAGPGTLEGNIPTHATETVDRRTTPWPPADPPAPAPEPPPVSPADIANELMRAADVGDTPPGGTPAAELERLLSSALDDGPAPAPAAPEGDGPALDPSQVAPGDFRGLAAGLIAELEASLQPERAEDRP